jgi:probable F420-dependent oxidoreductase
VIDIGRVGVWEHATRKWTPVDPGERREAVAELEELGYGAVWVGGADLNLALPKELLGASNRIAVATGIVNIWRVPATEVAAWSADLAAAYPSRFLLGLGAGHAVNSPHYDKPMEKLVEYFDELDAASPTVPVDGRVMAALGPRALRFAAERSLGTHPYLVTPEHTRMAREIMGPDALVAPEVKVVLESDPAKARAVARPKVASYLGLPNYVNNLRRLGFTSDDLSGEGSDRLVDALVAWGDPDAIAARVAEHHAAGADHVCVQVLGADGLPRAAWRALAAAFKF